MNFSPSLPRERPVCPERGFSGCTVTSQSKVKYLKLSSFIFKSMPMSAPQESTGSSGMIRNRRASARWSVLRVDGIRTLMN